MSGRAPTGTLDHIYPGLVEQKEREAIKEAETRACEVISDPIVRDTHPHLDFDTTGASEVAWDGSQPYFVQFDGATPAGEYEVYEVNSDNGRADERVVVIYGFQAILGGDLVTIARFEGSDDKTFELPNLQGLDVIGDVPTDTQTLLRTPVVFDLQDNGTISFGVEELDADDEVRIKLLAVTAEKEGRRVGTRQ